MWAVAWLGEQSSTCDRRAGLELERLVLEVASELVELVGYLRDPGLRCVSPASDERGVVRPPLDARLAGRVVVYLGDGVRVAIVGDPVDEIPAPPDGADAERSRRDASDEERHHERRAHHGRGE